MSQIEETTCCCNATASRGTGKPGKSAGRMGKYVLMGIVAIGAWYGVYASLDPVAKWFTYSLLQLERDRHFSSAVEFFIFETPKVLMLLTLVVFGVGIIRSFLPPSARGESCRAGASLWARCWRPGWASSRTGSARYPKPSPKTPPKKIGNFKAFCLALVY